MGIDAKFGSHLPVLIKLLDMTRGDVIEMGMGYFSTPFLHWACLDRKLFTYENYPKYYWRFYQGFHTDNHTLTLVDDWNDADIDRPWDVALIDHAPAERRIVDIQRLANLAKYIVIHDTDIRQEKHHHYAMIWPLFQQRYDHKVSTCHTTVVSNLVDLTGFSV